MVDKNEQYENTTDPLSIINDWELDECEEIEIIGPDEEKRIKHTLIRYQVIGWIYSIIAILVYSTFTIVAILNQYINHIYIYGSIVLLFLILSCLSSTLRSYSIVNKIIILIMIGIYGIIILCNM